MNLAIAHEIVAFKNTGRKFCEMKIGILLRKLGVSGEESNRFLTSFDSQTIIAIPKYNGEFRVQLTGTHHDAGTQHKFHLGVWPAEDIKLQNIFSRWVLKTQKEIDQKGLNYDKLDDPYSVPYQ